MTVPPPDPPTEWSAGVYHNVSTPHVTWGTRVLSQLNLRGDETAADLGCGTGRLTAELLEQLPEGFVVAVDRSSNMLDVASEMLDYQFPGRVAFVQADLSDINPSKLGRRVDLVFSTAAFHWISDHQNLFNRIYALLKPGGMLLAQCGGGPNLSSLLEQTNSIMGLEDFSHAFDGWAGPWNFADAESTSDRLARAGFTNIETSVFESPVVMEDEGELRSFLRTVIFGEHLARISTSDLQRQFIEHHIDWLTTQPGPSTLDYWRLDMKATRPKS